MSIYDPNSLECNLEPLEKIKPDLTKRHILSLKDSFNEDEVKFMQAWIGKRLFAYQFGHFYDYLPEVEAKAIEVKAEYFKDYDNKINDCKESFWNFALVISASFKNQLKEKNGGPDKLDGVTWHYSTSYINVFGLPKAAFINTEDLTFTTAEASFYGRSVHGLLQQEFYNRHREIIARNFNVIKADDPKYSESCTEIMKKQRDLSLTREETRALLESRTCGLTGRSYIEILDEDFDIVK